MAYNGYTNGYMEEDMTDATEAEQTWGHWCYEQEPTVLPTTIPRCPQCGAINLRRETSQ